MPLFRLKLPAMREIVAGSFCQNNGSQAVLTFLHPCLTVCLSACTSELAGRVEKSIFSQKHYG